MLSRYDPAVVRRSWQTPNAGDALPGCRSQARLRRSSKFSPNGWMLEAIAWMAEAAEAWCGSDLLTREAAERPGQARFPGLRTRTEIP